MISASVLALARLVKILSRGSVELSGEERRCFPRNKFPTHLLVVLGSGGHTAEMLNMLGRVPCLQSDFTHRTYVVSSGDDFSAQKAAEFEVRLESISRRSSYSIVVVQRARRVHQSFVSIPWSSIFCVWDCLQVLRGIHVDQQHSRLPIIPSLQSYPDLILTNGPGTGVCVVLASLILLFFGYTGPTSPADVSMKPTAPSSRAHLPYTPGHMRTIYVESWARVTTLSLSGKLLLPFVDRFLVQWPSLKGRGAGKAEFVGQLVE